jgi:hypothetical protein
MQTASIIQNEIVSGNTFYSQELPKLIQKIKKDCSWQQGDLKSLVILNDPDKKIVLTGMQAQTEIESYNKAESVMIHVIEGAIKISVRNNTGILVSGQKFTLTDKIPYKLESLTETFILLAITTPN